MSRIRGGSHDVQASAGEELDNREAPWEYCLLKRGEWYSVEVALEELGKLQLVKVWDGDAWRLSLPAGGGRVLPEVEVLAYERGLMLLV